VYVNVARIKTLQHKHDIWNTKDGDLIMSIDKDFNIAVGNRIRGVRETLRMTREQFSELCSISDSFLAAVEGGHKSITTKTLFKICTGANVSADYIVFGKKHNSDPSMIIELLNGMNSFQQECAIRILKEFSVALHKNNEEED